MGAWSEAADRLQKLLADGASMDDVEAAAARELDRIDPVDNED